MRRREKRKWSMDLFAESLTEKETRSSGEMASFASCWDDRGDSGVREVRRVGQKERKNVDQKRDILL